MYPGPQPWQALPPSLLNPPHPQAPHLALLPLLHSSLKVSKSFGVLAPGLSNSFYSALLWLFSSIIFTLKRVSHTHRYTLSQPNTSTHRCKPSKCKYILMQSHLPTHRHCQIHTDTHLYTNRSRLIWKTHPLHTQVHSFKTRHTEV